MTTPRLLLLLVALPSCDKLEGLLGRGESAPAATAEPAKAEPAKAEPAKAEPAKVAAATAAPAAAAPAAAAPAAAAPEAAAPAAAAPEAAAADAAPPCIVGRWRAIEYLAEVRRAIAKDPTLASMKRSSSGGLLGYEIGPVADGKGVVSAKAEALRYVFSGKVEGFPVKLTFTLDGEAEAAYTLEGDDTIIVAKPTKNTLVARANAKVEGFGKFSKSPKVSHEFDGTFVYECTDKTLKVWRNAKSGEPLDFERAAP